MSDSDVVEISVPASSAYVATLRLTASSLAGQADLTVDEIDDLALAVDEACALLLPHANGGPLTGRFAIAPGSLDVAVALSGQPGREVDRSGFAWTLLSALADNLQVGSGGAELSVAFTKRRQSAGS